jgi:N-acetylglucosamine-6-phosphate deacetylase
MADLLIRGADLVLPDSIAPGRDLLVDEGRILRVAAGGSIPAGSARAVVDGRGMYLAPGFIDLHLHGLLRYAVDRGPDDLREIGRALPAYGVTGFLPAVTPRPPGEDARFLAGLAAVESPGARILGFFLEGPFLALTGVLPPEAMSRPDAGRVESLRRAAGPHRAVFAAAPEADGVLELIPRMARGGTPVFLTHTRADVPQTEAGIRAGIRHATHFYDVFPCPPEKDPGVRPCGAVEAVLADPSVSVDFILDGEHVDPVAVRVALACKGPGGVCLITDANLGAGLPPGVYQGVGGEVRFAYPGGPARLTGNAACPGGLAGSGLTLDRAVRNARDLLGLELPQAVRMASLNPARVLGLEGSRGRIAEGCAADLVLLDRQCNVAQTWVGGRRCHPAAV